MLRPLRALTVVATTGMVIVGLSAAPAGAHQSDGSEGARILGQVAKLLPMDAGDADGVAPVTDDAHPVEAEVEIIDLADAAVTDSEDGAGDGLGATADEGEAESPDATDDKSGATIEETATGATVATFRAAASDLAVLGVSWAPGTAPEDLEIVWRSESADGWSDWEQMHHEGDHAHDTDEGAADGESDDAGVTDSRDGTDPAIAIGATAIEVVMSSTSGALPEDVNVAVIDPGESTADSAVLTDAESTSTGGGATTSVAGGSRLAPGAVDVPMAPSTTARPTIYSRAQWGADESMMTWTPSQGRVQGVTIHHTVNTNDYTSAQVPGIIRGIYAYHAQSWGRGWGDIGYNFLVDKFGRTWEGRSGGVQSAPTGAHATGLNSNFAGVSFIGNADTTAVPDAAFTAIARIAAWKLALHGNPTATGRVTVDAGTFNRVNGHRDSKQTTCPGRYLYDRLPELRTRITSYLGSFADRLLDRDLDGDGHSDLIAVSSSGAVSLVSSVDQGFWGRAQIGSGWAASRTVDAGDFNGDGYADLIHIQANGAMYLYPGDAAGRVHHETRQFIKTGWQYSNMVIGGADINGDGYPDLVARRTHGGLVTYFNDGKGGLQPAVFAATGFQGMRRLTLVENFISGSTALVAEHAASGGLFAYRINANGRLSGRQTITASGWGSMRLTTGVGDLTGDGVGDLVTIDPQHRMWLYPGVGGGGLAASEKFVFDRDRSGVAQLIGAGIAWGRPTFYEVDSQARLLIERRTQTAAPFSTLTPSGVTVGSGSRVVVPGDFTGDGRPDLFVITSAGALMLHPGLGGGQFRSTGTRIGTGNWSNLQVVGAGNWRGDGVSGLIAYQRSTGRLWYYASDGNNFFEPRVLVSNGASGMDYLVNAGLWNGSGAPDLLMRGADTGRLFFYNGNGPGLALPPAVIGTGWDAFTSIVGVNDVNNDGKPDLVAVTESGQVRIYAGNGSGGYGSYRTVGQVPAGTTLS